jgi:uncharacterized protein YbjT (DUF2867 family)
MKILIIGGTGNISSAITRDRIVDVWKRHADATTDECRAPGRTP